MLSSLSRLTLRNGYLQKRKKLKPWDGNWAGGKKPEHHMDTMYTAGCRSF
jgi:hypothetical protein